MYVSGWLCSPCLNWKRDINPKKGSYTLDMNSEGKRETTRSAWQVFASPCVCWCLNFCHFPSQVLTYLLQVVILLLLTLFTSKNLIWISWLTLLPLAVVLRENLFEKIVLFSLKNDHLRVLLVNTFCVPLLETNFWYVCFFWLFDEGRRHFKYFLFQTRSFSSLAPSLFLLYCPFQQGAVGYCFFRGHMKEHARAKCIRDTRV